MKIGGKVICINDKASFNKLRAGNIYTVEAAYNGDPVVIINGAYHSIERFEPVK